MILTEPPGSISIATDVALYVLPIAILVRIAIPRTKKALLILLFAHGALAIAATLARVLENRAPWNAS